MEGNIFRLGDTYIQAAEGQKWRLKVAPSCFKEITWASVGLAESQHLEREFMDRVLDCFMSTYNSFDWYQHCLPLRDIALSAATQPTMVCHAPLKGLFPVVAGMGALQGGSWMLAGEKVHTMP